jgi:hypothetical protein
MTRLRASIRGNFDRAYAENTADTKSASGSAMVAWRIIAG